MTFDYCCSRDGHGLEIPGFSAVFIQTFSIKQERQFFFRKNMTNIFRAMKIMFSIKRNSSMKKKQMH